MAEPLNQAELDILALETLKDNINASLGEAPDILKTSLDALTGVLPDVIQENLGIIEDKVAEIAGETIGKIVSGLVASLFFTAQVTGEATGLIIGSIAAFTDLGKQQALANITPTPLDPATLAILRFRRTLGTASFHEEMAKHGLSSDRADQFILSTRSILNPTEASVAARRGLLTDSEATDKIALHGLSQEEADVLLNLTRTFLGQVDLMELFRRAELTDEQFTSKLKETGLNEEDQQHAVTLKEVIPSITDQLRFLSREAYEPDQIAQLGLAEGYPKIFTEIAAKLGYKEEDALRFWYAHWALPSLGQVYEMVHRQVEKPEIIDIFMKAAEIPPRFRKGLTEIAFAPLTRVDVRRMYRLGLLDEEKVKTAYLHLGYNEEHAEQLKDFTVFDDIETQLGIIKARMLTLYRRGMVTEAALRAFLASLGRPQASIDLIISAENTLLAAEHLERLIRGVQKVFFKRLIDVPEALARVIAHGVPLDAATRLVGEWAVDREGRITRIRMRDLKKALKEGVINANEFRRELEERGMVPHEIDILIQLSDITTENDESDPPLPDAPGGVITPAPGGDILSDPPPPSAPGGVITPSPSGNILEGN